MHFCPPMVRNIRMPAGCGGRNPVFFTRHRLWYSPLQAISPGRRKYLCACRVRRTNSCLFHPALFLVRPPSSHFPRKAEIFVCPPGVTDEIPPFSPGTVFGTAPSSHFPRKAEIFVCLPGVADEILSFSPGAAILNSGTHRSEVQSLPSRLFSSQAGIGNAMILS